MISSSPPPRSSEQIKLELQKEIQFACKEERDDSLLNEFPTDTEKGIYYLDLKTDPDTKEPPLELYNKPVKKMRLIVCARSYDINHVEENILKGEACLYIHWLDGTNLTKTVKKDQTNSLFALFKKLGAEPKIHFAEMNKSRMPWTEESVTDCYGGILKKEYGTLHQKIIKATIRVVRRARLSQFNLIDIGCGNGKLLSELEQEAQATIEEVNLVGLDYNYSNIYDAKTNYQGNCQFFLGNSLHIDKVLANCFEKGIFNKNYPTFLSMSGSITRLVLNNGFEAVRILQKAALNHVDYLVGGGITVPLFNEFMAKKIGYTPIDLAELKDIPGKHFFLYRRLSKDEILKSKIKKIQTKKWLDLSLSPEPEEILKILNEQGYIQEGLIIDLSFCEMRPALVNQLRELAKNFKELKLVGWHWDISFLKTLNEMRDIFSNIDTQLITQDCYLMGPREFFLSLHEKELFKTNKLTFSLDEESDYEKYLLNMDDLNVIEIKLKNGESIANICLAAGNATAYQVAYTVFQKDSKLYDRTYEIFKCEATFLSFYKLLLDSNRDISICSNILKYYNGNFSKIITLLEEAQINPNQIKDKEGNTLLHLMTLKGLEEELSKKFLENNSDFINRRNNKGQTALHLATNSGKEWIFQYFLNECKADYTIKDNKGANVLHYAAKHGKGKPNVIAAIVEIDKDFIKHLDNDGRSVVHYAVLAKKYKLLPILDKYGADLLARDRNGDSALELSIKNKTDLNDDSVQETLTYYKNKFGLDILNQSHPHGKTLALIAMKKNDAATVIQLHDAGTTILQIFDPMSMTSFYKKRNSNALCIFMFDIFSKIDPTSLCNEPNVRISLVKLATMMTKLVEYLEDIKVDRGHFLKLLNCIVSSLARGLGPKVELMLPLIKYLIDKGAQPNEEIGQRINLSSPVQIYTVATVPQRSQLLNQSKFFTNGRHPAHEKLLQMKHIRIAK